MSLTGESFYLGKIVFAQNYNTPQVSTTELADFFSAFVGDMPMALSLACPGVVNSAGICVEECVAPELYTEDGTACVRACPGSQIVDKDGVQARAAVPRCARLHTAASRAPRPRASRQCLTDCPFGELINTAGTQWCAQRRRAR